MGATPDWQPDEAAFAGRENLDPEHVARYDAKEDADASAEVARLAGYGLTPGSLVVEFGPGTGQFTLAAAQVAGRVIAVDPSAPMRAALASKISRAGVRNVEIIEAGFLSYQHAQPEPADVVYSRYALHHLPDAWKAVALTRMHDLLRPGGILRLWDVVYDFEPGQAPGRFEEFAQQGGHDVEAQWSRAEIAEHLREEHSTFAWLMEPMLRRSGFVIEAAEPVLDGFAMRYLARRPLNR